MGIKIKKLYIKNFKVYKEQTFDFKDIGLIVFDGPNGFGKTTIYDAIELLFTNQIKRYKRLDHLIDGRERRNENPLYNAEGTDGEIIIKLQFSFENVEYIIAVKNAKAIEPVINFNHFKLHRLTNFEEIIDESNEVDDGLLKEILGLNYNQDFEFINYVEQEDTFHYLKSKEQDKKQNIGYLFNTHEFNVKINKYSNLNDAIESRLKGDNGLQSKIQLLAESIKGIEDSLKKVDTISFNKLFVEKDFEWDKEEIDFNKISYNQLFNDDDNTFQQLESLVINKNDFINYIHNHSIDRLLDNEDILQKFYYYENFRKEEQKLEEEADFLNDVIEFKKLFKEFEIDEIINHDCNMPEVILNKYWDNEVIVKYQHMLEEITINLKNSNSAEKIYSRILSSRDTLKIHLLDYHNKLNDNGICPLCGNDYISSEELIRNIEEQKTEIELLNKNLDKRLANDTESFINFVKETLFDELDKFTKDFMYNSEYFKSDFFDIEINKVHDKIKDKLESFNTNYSKYISTEIKENTSGFEIFKNLIEDSKLKYNQENIDYYYNDAFGNFFSSNQILLQKTTLEDLKSKRKFIEWQHSIHQNNLLGEKKEELIVLTQKNKKLYDSQLQIRAILDVLNESLREYSRQLIKDIELLFHIYSGRIVQDFQGGLGLFIIDRGDKIKFVSSPSKTYDAIFSMSTGQLSALILSFTLALNKKYSKSKLLLIDDPVQAMDDINTAGFVELLRNDFSDRQIILSTHEQMLSNYIRYKFKKFNIDSLRIDLSKIKNSTDA
jgi:exonuclease SbcC